LALVVVVRTWPVSALVTVTVTFGTTAPLASVTVPVSAPVEVDCATSDGANPKNTSKTKTSHAYREFL
jgi:hypothetical protein